MGKRRGSFLAQRWKLISEDSLRLVAAQLASMPDWRKMSPEFAAKQFVLWTEANCWVSGVNSAESLPVVMSHQCFTKPVDDAALAIFRSHDMPPAQAASVCLLREIWGGAGYPDGVRPTSAAIDAIRVWQMAEEAVSKVYGEPVTLHLEMANYVRWQIRYFHKSLKPRAMVISDIIGLSCC